MADAIFRLKDTFKIFKIIWGPSGAKRLGLLDSKSGGGTNNEAALVQSDLRREFSNAEIHARAQEPETRDQRIIYDL